MPDFNDLLGDEPPKKPSKSKRARGRPSREAMLERDTEELAAEQARLGLTDNKTPHYSEFRKPVGITFLAAVMGRQPKQIEKRLEKCPVHSWHLVSGKQKPLYEFMDAMSYLVPPRGSIEDWFAQQNAASLPPYVNKMWWDSAAQRNRVMLDSNDLWHTDDVLVLLGRAHMAIKEECKMWVEELPEKEILTDKQYAALIDAQNRLVLNLRKIFIEMPRETLSMTAHIQSELDASGRVPNDADRPNADDEE